MDPKLFYNSRVNQFGYSAKSVGWQSFEQQKLRFKILVSDLNLENVTLLDVGCGFGDLFEFIIFKKINLKGYIGIDISEEMIEYAKNRIADPKASFKVQNFLSSDFPPSDVVIMSGVLNYRVRINKYALLETFLRKSAHFAKCVSFNLLTDKVDYMQPINNHFNLQVATKVAKEHFNTVKVFENYGLHEFTLICKRN